MAIEQFIAQEFNYLLHPLMTSVIAITKVRLATVQHCCTRNFNLYCVPAHDSSELSPQVDTVHFSKSTLCSNSFFFIFLLIHMHVSEYWYAPRGVGPPSPSSPLIPSSLPLFSLDPHLLLPLLLLTYLLN